MLAEFWSARGDGLIQCGLCPHGCVLSDGQSGRCRVRQVMDDRLQALSYGRVSSLNVDPIEKKPLYHFCPGDAVFSVGGWGCNFHCVFCQNWTISQRVMDDGPRVSPQELVAEARRRGSCGIAYTYNEPLIAFEYVRDCAALARASGLYNVLVTNGFVNEAPARALLPLIDAANIDLKSMDDAFYRKHCGGRLAPVQRFAAMARGVGVHVEVTNLVIPGLNDSDEAFGSLAAWVADELGAQTPLHLSAYHPQFEMTRDSTPPETLVKAARMCRERLRYVYLGNVATREGCDTSCPQCSSLLVRRAGYTTRLGALDKKGACLSCGRPFDGIVRYR